MVTRLERRAYDLKVLNYNPHRSCPVVCLGESLLFTSSFSNHVQSTVELRGHPWGMPSCLNRVSAR